MRAATRGHTGPEDCAGGMELLHDPSCIGLKHGGMGSLEAITKGSERRYYGDTQALKIAQVGWSFCMI